MNVTIQAAGAIEEALRRFPATGMKNAVLPN
jgi:hypothetical protein